MTTTSPAPRVWTVRVGTTGRGMDMFQVYGATMADARGSVLRTLTESNASILADLQELGFTVHAGVPCRMGALGTNPFARAIPVPDYVAAGAPA